MVFIVCLNVAAFILQQSGALPVSRELYASPFDITNQFGFGVFMVLIGGLAGMSLVAIIFKANIYALGALLVWVIAALTPIVQWFLVGFPIVLAALLPPELSYLTAVVGAFFSMMFFMFLTEIVGQRQIT